MSQRIAFRGPDGRRVWLEDEAGLGHAHLATTPGSPDSFQPLSLDGKVWITADARIDARAELRRKLESLGRGVDAEASDAALVLHAYHAWGEDCASHLLGDFAFGIWDARRKRLFCARDHFGVKPFFHAIAGGCFVFSNTFTCVRNHPGVPQDLNESAIADFLLFEMSQDAAATGFAGIRRLPPAHCLTASRDGVEIRPYWKLPYESPVVHRRDAREYVEGFTDVLASAVADRMPKHSAAILMSGGMDSSAVAALASRCAQDDSAADLRAFTIVYDRMFPDEERLYSGLVAHHLGIPVHYQVADDYALFQDFDRLKAGFAEPVHEPFAALDVDLAREAALHARVILTGWDGDTLLTESPRPYFRSLLRQGDLARLIPTAARFVASEHKLAPVGMWRSLFPWLRTTPKPQSLPAWLDHDFARRLQLRERLLGAREDLTVLHHPIRPYAYRTLESLMRISRFFEFSDPGFTRAHIEYRHPFLDLRVAQFCLSLPPYPWCTRKRILRDSMKGLLPPRVLARPKTPLGGYPHQERIKSGEFRRVDPFNASRHLARYVNKDKIPVLHDAAEPSDTWMNLRPLCLDWWLRSVDTPSSQSKEPKHEFA